MRSKLNVSTLVMVIAAAVMIMPASAATIEVLAVEDTYIGSNAGTTNYSLERFLMLRSVSAATRGSLVQFTLPVSTKLVVDQLDLTMYGGSVSGDFPDVEVLATTTPIDLTAVTWNSAVTNGLISGAEADYTVAWNPAAWTTTGQTWNIDAITTSSTEVYTDATTTDGLLKFINDNWDGTSAMTFTIALGFSATEAGTGGASFRSKDDATPAAGQPNPPTPRLLLTYTVIPEPSAAVLLILGSISVLAGRRRNTLRHHPDL